ncbi:MAG: hypothetical protein IIA54_09175 [Chloroflexi bacterium]|nr:hypothetical protein [Chloroflexota bacterium]
MRTLIIVMAGGTAGVIAAIVGGARAELRRQAERHGEMPDVTAGAEAHDG